MEKIEMLEGILNSYPYPIVFVDNDYIIRFINKNAQYHYYEERGYKNLIGKSLFESLWGTFPDACVVTNPVIQ